VDGVFGSTNFVLFIHRKLVQYKCWSLGYFKRSVVMTHVFHTKRPYLSVPRNKGASLDVSDAARQQPVKSVVDEIQAAGIPVELIFAQSYTAGIARGKKMPLWRDAAILTFPDQAAHSRFRASNLMAQGVLAAQRSHYVLVAALATPTVK
jgi:hypothetical protein